MNQGQLFHESIYDALGTLVNALGGPKKVGPMLWPEKTLDAAAQLVRDCCNPTRKERFDPEQMTFLKKKGREIGCHAVMYFECDECGYARPAVIEPEDELTKLLREYLGTKKRGDSLESKIEERLANLRVVGVR